MPAEEKVVGAFLAAGEIYAHHHQSAQVDDQHGVVEPGEALAGSQRSGRDDCRARFAGRQCSARQDETVFPPDGGQVGYGLVAVAKFVWKFAGRNPGVGDRMVGQDAAGRNFAVVCGLIGFWLDTTADNRNMGLSQCRGGRGGRGNRTGQVGDAAPGLFLWVVAIAIGEFDAAAVGADCLAAEDEKRAVLGGGHRAMRGLPGQVSSFCQADSAPLSEISSAQKTDRGSFRAGLFFPTGDIDRVAQHCSAAKRVGLRQGWKLLHCDLFAVPLDELNVGIVPLSIASTYDNQPVVGGDRNTVGKRSR